MTGNTPSKEDTGLSLNYSIAKTINGRVVRPDGTPVFTRFYVQDISQTPPQLVATYQNNADGHYSFKLYIGQWRIVPVSADFQFEPRAREYDTRLLLMGQRVQEVAN